jgi:FkbM family methyltransferase
LPPLLAQQVRAWLVPYAQARRDDRLCESRAITGSRLEGRTGDFHFYPFSVQGYYDWRNVAIAAALVRGGETIVEIGANVGTETVCFSDLVGPAGRVHAIEPLPANVAWLRRAEAHVVHDNITLHPCALSDRTGTAAFAEPPAHHSGVGHLAAGGDASAQLRVDCETLDNLLAAIGPVHLIFMDVEGEELNVLRGGLRQLRARRPPLVLEASPKLLERAGATIGALHRLLLDLGYAVYEIARFGLKPAAPAQQARACNWLCLSSEDRVRRGRIARCLLRAGLLPCVRGLNPLVRRT